VEEHQLAVVLERGFERAELGIQADESLELGGDDVVAIAVEAVGVEDEAAEVAERELAGAAEVAQPAAQAGSIPVARGRVRPPAGGATGVAGERLLGDVELHCGAAASRVRDEWLVFTILTVQ
jgi:hypothetical protein